MSAISEWGDERRVFSSVLCGFKSREDITKDAAARTLNFVILNWRVISTSVTRSEVA